jgi:hypothetical protein
MDARNILMLGSRWWLAVALSVLVAACGDGGSSSPASGGNTAVGETVSGIASPSGFAYTAYSAPAIANGTCTGAGDATAAISRIQFAQTVLMETSSPFFHLSAGRNTAIRVVITGSGAAPDVAVTAQVNGTTLGTVCLNGPATLPSAEPALVSTSDSFTGNIPAAWMVAGLQLSVTAGGATTSIPSTALKVGAQPALTLVTGDWLLWGDTQPAPKPANFMAEFASRLAISQVQHSNFPVTIAASRLPIGIRSDGRLPDGTITTTPARVADGPSHCSATDKTNGTCTAWSGSGLLHSVRSLMGVIQAANGMKDVSHWYAALGQNRQTAGGLGGGSVAAGDNYTLIFNHEMGHTFDMPHWGDKLYTRAVAGENQAHPYTGAYLNSANLPLGGGYGNAWGFDPAHAPYFFDPVCAATGTERQEPMQRTGTTTNACVPNGETYDFFQRLLVVFHVPLLCGCGSRQRHRCVTTRFDRERGSPV